MSSLCLVCAGLPETPANHLSVDGMSPVGPNLSHWPGNRTPGNWKADLSTGICLRFAGAEEDARREFLGGAWAVLNDHYDTDGFLSLLAVLRPGVALARVDRLLAAAGTGDFQSFQGREAFAVDRIVANLGGPGGPLAGACSRLAGGEKDFLRYRWLLDHAEAVLDRPEQFSSLFAEELALVERQLGDPSIECELRPEAGLALVRSRGPVHRLVLNTRAQGCFRVLHTETAAAGSMVRFHSRTESWFEVATFTPPPRPDLRPLVEELRQAEAEIGPGAGEWCLDPETEPVPELYHGEPSVQAYGQISRILTPSRVPVDQLEDRFRTFLTGR